MGKAHSPNFSAEKLLPSGTSQSEVLSPYLLRQQKDVKYWRTTSDSRVPLSSALSADAKGFQKGRSPFRWKSKNQEVFGASFVDFFATRNRPRCGSRRPAMWFAGTFLQKYCGLRKPAIGVSAKPYFRQCGHKNETCFILQTFAKRVLQEPSDNRKRGFPKGLVPFGKPLF